MHFTIPLAVGSIGVGMGMRWAWYSVLFVSGHRATNKFIPLMFNPAGTQNQGGIQNRGRCGFCSTKKKWDGDHVLPILSFMFLGYGETGNCDWWDSDLPRLVVCPSVTAKASRGASYHRTWMDLTCARNQGMPTSTVRKCDDFAWVPFPLFQGWYFPPSSMINGSPDLTNSWCSHVTYDLHDIRSMYPHNYGLR